MSDDISSATDQRTKDADATAGEWRNEAIRLAESFRFLAFRTGLLQNDLADYRYLKSINEYCLRVLDGARVDDAWPIKRGYEIPAPAADPTSPDPVSNADETKED